MWYIYSIILVHAYINLSLFKCNECGMYSIILVHTYINLSLCRCNECGVYSIILVHAYINLSLFRCNECGVVTDHLPAMKHCLSFLDNWYKSCDPVTSILTTGNSTVITVT